jgi:hypothetical protein
MASIISLQNWSSLPSGSGVVGYWGGAVVQVGQHVPLHFRRSCPLVHMFLLDTYGFNALVEVDSGYT